MKKILFVCKYNRFRSRIAEAYFNKINKNKNFKAESAGIFKGSYPLDSQQLELTKKQSINIQGKPRGISVNLLKKMDIIIIVADNIPKNLFKFKDKYLQEIIVWKIPDGQNGNEENIIKIINSIKNKVDILTKKLKMKK
jgi:protein-tyrosine-phosphatase